MRRLGTALVALALALMVAGMAVFPLLGPSVTAALSARLSTPEVVGLDPATALELAESARAYVGDVGEVALVASDDPRQGFDASSLAHLADVRRVVNGARLLTGLLAGAITIWLAVLLVRGRFELIADGLRAGGIACAVLVAAAALFGVVSFDALFAWFHSLFFAPGTWQFPADSLLIVLFPESFWVACGLAWAALILLGGGLLWFAGGSVAKTGENRAQHASS